MRTWTSGTGSSRWREDDRNLDFLREVVRRIWRVLKSAEAHAQELFPALRGSYPDLPDEVVFLHAEELLERYPGLPRKQRETAILQEHPAVFIVGIGWTLADGYPHELRASDYDDWSTEVTTPDGQPAHGLNGDLLVWNPVTLRRHELSSMGIRVDAVALRRATRDHRAARLARPSRTTVRSPRTPCR